MPGINLAWWRWKDSRDVEPRAQRSTGRFTPPLVRWPVLVWNGNFNINNSNEAIELLDMVPEPYTLNPQNNKYDGIKWPILTSKVRRVSLGGDWMAAAAGGEIYFHKSSTRYVTFKNRLTMCFFWPFLSSPQDPPLPPVPLPPLSPPSSTLLVRIRHMNKASYTLKGQ